MGLLTIGAGRNLDANGISMEECEFLLMNDILSASEAVGAALPWTEDLDDARRHVLINMAFNMGIDRLAHPVHGFVNTLQAVKEGRYDDAAEGMLDSKWATQVGNRAKELAEQMRTGVER